MTMTWTTTVSRMVWRASDDPLITWAVQVGATQQGGDGGGTAMPSGSAGQVPQISSGSTYVLRTPNTPNGLARLDGDGTLPDILIPATIARDSEVTAAVNAAVTALVNSAPGLLDTLDELAAALGDDPTFAATVTSALAGKQTASATLTLLAALTTTSYGRALLELADAAAARTALGLGTAATAASGDFQPADSDLTAIAALTTTTFGRSLLTQATAAAARSTLGIGGIVAGQGNGPNISNSTTETSLLTSTVTLPAIATGEVLLVDAAYRFLNNSGAGRAPTFRLKVGATTLVTVAPAQLGSSATERTGVLSAVIRSNGNNEQTASLQVEHYLSTGGDAGSQGANYGSGTEAMQNAGLALDITGQLAAAATTLQLQLTMLSVRRVST